VQVNRVEAGSSEKARGDRGRNGAPRWPSARWAGLSRRPWRRREHGLSFASQTWVDVRVSRGRIDVGRAERMCATSWRKQRSLVSEPTWSWGTTSMSAEETRLPRPRRRRPGPAHPHGGVGGRPVPEETGRRVGRLRVVVGDRDELVEAARGGDIRPELRLWARK